MKTQTTAVIPKLFIGMDVDKKSWTAHFKTDLFDNKTVTMPAEPSSLISYVQKNFEDHAVSCCYEAGCCGYWIARELLQKGWEVKVVNPADVPKNNKQDNMKDHSAKQAAVFTKTKCAAVSLNDCRIDRIYPGFSNYNHSNPQRIKIYYVDRLPLYIGTPCCAFVLIHYASGFKC